VCAVIRPGPGLGLGAFSLAPTAATIGRVDAYAVLVRLEEGHWRIDPGPFALAPPSNPRSLGPWLASFDAGRLWLDGVRTTTAAVRHAPIGHHVLVAYARRDGDEGAVAWSLPLRKPPPGSPGARLTRLVAAANAGDVPMMWRLRSRETRERLGPTLPAFVTPAVLNVLVEKFGLKGVTKPAADLAEILGPAPVARA